MLLSVLHKMGLMENGKMVALPAIWEAGIIK
jgi:hypothetical protein